MPSAPERIAPSILNADVGELARNLERLEAAGVGVLHLDVMDGVFVPVLTFGAPVCKAITARSQVPVEAHLMVQRPDVLVQAFADAGCSRLVVHPEADPHVHRTLQAIQAAGMEAGVALNPGTPVQVLDPLVDLLDLVLVMTVNPGWGGQAFLDTMLPKVEATRQRLDAAGRGAKIEVDGGMNPENIRRCRDAGTDLFVVGSWIFRHEGGIEPAVAALGEAAA